MKALLLEDIKSCIGMGDIEPALSWLEKYSITRPELENEVIIYKGRYYRASKDKRIGKITRSEADAALTLLSSDILEFVKQELSAVSDKIVYKKKIPVVVVVMTKKEAEEFFQHSQEFSKLINKREIKNITNRYGNRRDEWCPFNVKKNVTVWDILREFADKITISSPSYKAFHAEFESNTDFFFNGENKFHISKNLKEKGCLFIIDAISIFHSNVYETFINHTDNINKEQVGTFVISPLNMKQERLNNLLGNKIYDSLKLFFENYDTVLSPQRGLGISDKTELNRNLKVCLERSAYMLEPWGIEFEQADIKKKGIRLIR
ncbi:hypothetical protein QUF72_05080 [Desulfobacterales bacterium HSG2]|nr:hypothetical protein [Desulfobacterales bacterium HSG2]